MHRRSLTLLLLAAALAAGPGWAESTDWRFWLDEYLGGSRNQLMQECALGRKMNSAGLSYWDYDHQKRVTAIVLAKGFSHSSHSALNSGKAAAMARVCPDVR